MWDLGLHIAQFIFVLCFSATVFNNANQQINVYGDDIEVDYRGYEVHTVISLIDAHHNF